jgi:hypothetical protein
MLNATHQFTRGYGRPTSSAMAAQRRCPLVASNSKQSSATSGSLSWRQPRPRCLWSAYRSTASLPGGRSRVIRTPLGPANSTAVIGTGPVPSSTVKPRSVISSAEGRKRAVPKPRAVRELETIPSPNSRPPLQAADAAASSPRPGSAPGASHCRTARRASDSCWHQGALSACPSVGRLGRRETSWAFPVPVLAEPAAPTACR